jgi:hypothetical protein
MRGSEMKGFMYDFENALLRRLGLEFGNENASRGIEIWKLTLVVIVVFRFIFSCVLRNFGLEKFAIMENLR